MAPLILLDTHVLVWMALEDRKLGRRAQRAIDRAAQSDGVAVSAISFWEVATLLERGRLRLDVTADEFRASTLATGVSEIALDGEIAVLSARLTLGADPCDRFIVATALARALPLLTADEKILDTRGGPKLIDARR